jgi:hypothetical protein
MILWAVIFLFALTGVLAGIRFFKKKDPFGGLDSEIQSKNSSLRDSGNHT